jgi:putative endonuclease
MKLKEMIPFKRKTKKSNESLSDSTSKENLAPHLELGRRGEKLAAILLESEGYRLVASNFTLPVGRNTRGAIVNGEIDIIAYDGVTLCFVEVKTRTSDDFAAPEASVDRRKQRQITRTARAYRKMFGLHECDYRYDVVSIVIPKEGEEKKLQIELLKNFWTDEKFRKRKWSHDDFGY